MRPLQSVDMTRRLADLGFRDAVVSPSTIVGPVGDAAADVERQLQFGVGPAERRDRRCGRLRLRLHLGVRQETHGVRPPHRLVPGPEASLRRHEGVAGSVSRNCDGRCRGWAAGAKTTRSRLVSVAKAYIVGPSSRDHTGLRPAARRHRRDLGARRPAPLPAPDRTERGRCSVSACDHRLRVATLMGV